MSETDNEVLCQGCSIREGTKDLHPCPFQVEINGCPAPVCNCCDECMQECQEGVLNWVW